MYYICGVREIKTPIINKNFTIMATNKIYKVERIERVSRLSDTIYSGRIRDCKRSLASIEEEYRKRGYITLNTGFALFIYTESAPIANWIYIIKEERRRSK